MRMAGLTTAERLDPAEAVSPKRRAILSAASALFMAQGYEAVSMDAVARAAGVSKATLYAHFGAKDRLFASIVHEACDTLRHSSIGSFEAAGLPLREALLRLGRQWLRFMLNDTAIAVRRTVIAEGPKFPELARAFYDNGPRLTRVWLGGWIAGEMARGRIRRADPDRAADQFVSLVMAEVVLRVTLGLEPRPDDAELEQQIEAAVDTFHRAYAAGD
jgi:TetR/AcrR family transcriptional regulator, mexJK operon transcriptional repressor